MKRNTRKTLRRCSARTTGGCRVLTPCSGRYSFCIILFGLCWVSLYLKVKVLTSSRHPATIVTHAKLGRQYTGRLGNQMFQMASVIGVALDRSYNYDFISSISKIEVGQVFKVEGNLTEEDLTVAISIAEDKPSFQSFDLSGTVGKVALDGYLQSPLYFSRHREYLEKKVFKMHSTLLEEAMATWPEVIDDATICMHVRREDYLAFSHLYTILDINYYATALKVFDVPKTILVFSTDLEWCKKEFSMFRNFDIRFSNFSFALDFVLLSKCKNIVIANSSFSWWAAFLFAANKTVVAPSPWYRPDGDLGHLNSNDMYVDGWNIVQT